MAACDAGNVGVGVGTDGSGGVGGGAVRQAPTRMRASVVVVGAGLAGLTAADALARAMESQGGTAGTDTGVVVLEAWNDIGGRMRTVVEDDGFAADLGATWIGPTQLQMTRLVERFSLRTHGQFVDGRKRMELNGRVTSYGGLVPNMSLLGLLETQFSLLMNIDSMASQIPLNEPWKCPRAEKWDSMSVRAWAEATVASRDAVDTVELLMGAVLGCQGCDMSLLHFLYYVRSAGGIKQLVETRGGAQHEHIVGGAAQVCSLLADAIKATGCGRIFTNAPVTHIRGWDADASPRAAAGSHDFPITVVARVPSAAAPSATLTVQCQRVVVAVPPSMCTRIAFAPHLPAVRTQLQARVLMPCMSKFILRYPTAWWREQLMSGEGVRYQASPSSPICTVFDYCQPAGSAAGSAKEHHAALVGFAAANVSLALTRLSPADRKAAVVSSFVRLFGAQAASFTAYFEQQWETEEWTGGCPVNVFPAGQFCRFARVLRAPCGRLHWAGTETATVWTGYMDGAVQSGLRAAAEVASALPSLPARERDGDGDVGALSRSPDDHDGSVVHSGDGYEAGRHPRARRRGLYNWWHIGDVYKGWLLVCALAVAALWRSWF